MSRICCAASDDALLPVPRTADKAIHDLLRDVIRDALDVTGFTRRTRIHACQQ
jgi:hypothetical protein